MAQETEAALPENKSKLIRTFAKDVASLGQTLPKEFTPDAAPIKKPVIEKKKPEPEKIKKPIHEAIPASVRTTPSEDPSFVPVAPRAKKEEVVEMKPSPMPFSVPFPSPMPAHPVQAPAFVPPPKKEEELSPIHTYKTDFAEHIDTKKASTFSVLASQLDAGNTPPPQTLVKEKNTFPILPVVFAVVLVLSGVGGVWFAYTATQHPEIGIPAFSVPTLVFADDRKELIGPDFSSALIEALNNPLEEGKIRILYSATASSTANGILHIPNEGTYLISNLNLQAPDLLLRNIDPISTTGMLRLNNDTSPFFVLRASSYERTFSAMLSWESRIANDLAWLYPSTVRESEATTGTTTASTTPLTLPLTLVFKDKVIGNYNMRVLLNAKGESVLCYGYKDKQTLIIAKTPEAFVALSGRLVEKKIMEWYAANMKDITYYKEKLENEKMGLELALETVGRRNPSNPADWEAVPQTTGQEADIADAAETSEEFEDNAAILNGLEIRYNEVLAALTRISDGTYGLCVVSGEEIAEDRLEANPSASTCSKHM